MSAPAANPFETGQVVDGVRLQTVDTAGRLDAVKVFTADECRAGLLVPGLQQTVRSAIERRRRKLQREGRA